MKPAIRVNNLSKQYQVGAAHRTRYRTLRECLSDAASLPFRWLQRAWNEGQSRGGRLPPSDEFWALEDVSFDVRPGEVLGVIGRNGAGKSTLLKILSRITEPSDGTVECRGRVGSLLEVGTGFHQELTGRENIFLNGAILGMSRREILGKFAEIVEFAEIEAFLDTPVKRYSTGMYLRLAFAVAAHLEPEILIVDEVLAVGDQAFQSKCMGKLGEIGRSGRTVLFVSHNMAAILNLCQRVAVLQRGRLSYFGDCEAGVEVYSAIACNEGGSEAGLSEHPGRPGRYATHLHTIRLLNQSGMVTDQFLCGEPLIVELEADCGSLGPSLLDFVITLEDSYGAKLATVATYLSECGPVQSSGRSWVTCRVGNLPLAPGRYFLSLDLGVARDRVIDSVDRAASFSVGASDFYGNGQHPNARQGYFLVRSDWRLM